MKINTHENQEKTSRRDFLKLGIFAAGSAVGGILMNNILTPKSGNTSPGLPPEKPTLTDIVLPTEFLGSTIPQSDKHTELFAKEVKYILEKYFNAFYMPIFKRNYAEYMPTIEHIIAQKELPIEIKNIPIVESSLIHTAVSKKGAAGHWQIMADTGKDIGLKVPDNASKRRVGIKMPVFDPKKDERFDLHKSSHAATEYLKKLNKSFSDWLLTFAAYNYGWGNIRKATNNYEIGDFFEITDHLPAETRQYIYKVMAYHQVLSHPYYKMQLQIPDTPESSLPQQV